MENIEKRSDGAALPVSSYSPDDNYDALGLRGYSIEMYTRRLHALRFRQIRRDAKCALEEKFCLLPCGFPDYWHENLYGFTRVVVHGVDSLCVVARTEDVERVMCQAKEAYEYMCDMVLESALIYEAEDLALHHGELGKMTCRTFEKPFVAVSVMPGPNNSVPEASSDEYDVESAIGFVWEEMNVGTTFTFDESVKTAIFTLQHLFSKRFKANEIKVFYVKNHSGGVVGGKGRSEKANVLPMRGERCINDHLAVINKPRTGGSSSSEDEEDVPSE